MNKTSKRVSLPSLRRMVGRLTNDWYRLHQAGADDTELMVLAQRFQELRGKADDLCSRRELAAAERKDRRLGYPVLWTVFAPDSVLGMMITTRTPNRLLRQQVPTWVDVIGSLLFGKKEDLDRYKEAGAAAKTRDVLTDLDAVWHGYGWNEAKHAAAVGKRVDEVMAKWQTSRYPKDLATHMEAA